MKHTILLLTMLCIFTGLRAGTVATGKDVLYLTRILSDNVTRKEIKEKFGVATYITINNKTGEESWRYSGVEDELYIVWDTKKSKIRLVSYITPADHKRNAPKRYSSC